MVRTRQGVSERLGDESLNGTGLDGTEGEGNRYLQNRRGRFPFDLGSLLGSHRIW